LQQDGYWDKESYTTKEIIVARDHHYKTDDFPVGTTELILTLLDDNQQMAGSLVSLLKAIPDPTGIVKVLRVVFLLSKVSGDDNVIMLYFHLVMLLQIIKSGKHMMLALFRRKL
jgi:hypothetical protein